jgi:hypothetical protein
MIKLTAVKRNFDPNNKADLAEFAYFLKNRTWKDVCPFNLEWPHLSIPDMLKTKITENLLLN